MKVVISLINYAITFLCLQKLIPYVQPFSFKCPSQSHWKLRAINNCNSFSKYFCLYNNAKREYEEGCEGPDWDRKGSKRVYSGDFTRGKCEQDRLQPFIFWTNGSMSNCVYKKSICNDEGQYVFNDGSSKADRTCRCNHKKNYSFITAPRNNWYCIPTEEDCSCYIKSCPLNLTLSADYDCKQNGENTKCEDNEKHHGALDEKNPVKVGKKDVLVTGDNMWALMSNEIFSRIFISIFVFGVVCSPVVILLRQNKRNCNLRQSADSSKSTSVETEVCNGLVLQIVT